MEHEQHTTTHNTRYNKQLEQQLWKTDYESNDSYIVVTNAKSTWCYYNNNLQE